MTVMLVNSGFLAPAVRETVTIFWPPISGAGDWAWLLITTKLATAAGKTKENTQVRRRGFMMIHPETHSDFPECLMTERFAGA
jgi:hypothetical protein